MSRQVRPNSGRYQGYAVDYNVKLLLECPDTHVSVLLSIYQRSSANIHGRPTDESSISSKSAVHFLKMIHLRDFAPFICFIERRILFSRSGIKLCCFQISPTLRWSQARASPLRRRRPQPGGHPGLGFNHINQVPANPYLQHFHQFNKRFS